eukprot:TRINITY_DN10443_c0_g1_i1.p1 TRINITY_DN10443_c0_g1~~TRINITY_DN10443_c0_g1_i1.p1  ORF type:complete len:674 (+),score=168.87 TRINITY_DN10443_c0_g1_i1:108-2129(+)
MERPASPAASSPFQCGRGWAVLLGAAAALSVAGLRFLGREEPPPPIPSSGVGEAGEQLAAAAERMEELLAQLQGAAAASQLRADDAVARARRWHAALVLAQRRHLAASAQLAEATAAAFAAERALERIAAGGQRHGGEDPAAEAQRIARALRTLAAPPPPHEAQLRAALRSAQEALEDSLPGERDWELAASVVREVSTAASPPRPPAAAGPLAPVFAAAPVVWPRALGVGERDETPSHLLNLSGVVAAAAAAAAARLGVPVPRGRLSAFNPSLISAPAWLARQYGVGSAWLGSVKVAGFHSCDLRIDTCPDLEALSDHSWVSELGWALLGADGAALRPLQQGAIPLAVGAVGVKVTRVAQPVGPTAERVTLRNCLLEDPRLFRLGTELWLSWVAAGRMTGQARCPFIAWPLAQRTFLTPLTLQPGRGGEAVLEGDAGRTVQLTVAGLSHDCVSEKNINFFSDSNGSVWAEYQIEPHLLCRVDTTTGLCFDLIATSVPDLRAAPEELRGTAGFVDISFPPGHPLHGGSRKMLGVGHTNRHPARGARGTRKWRYSSFFYVFDAEFPFQLRAVSSEFCFRFVQGYEGKEQGLCPQRFAHQMVFGVTWDQDALLLSYGEQDCAPRVQRIDGAAVRRALSVPLRPAQRVSPAAVAPREGRKCRRLARRRWRSATAVDD